MSQPVNLVDAVAEVVPRLARARSAIVRIGRVVATPTGALVDVRLGDSSGGVVPAAYPASYRPAANDQVAMVNDRDMWLVLYPLATAPPAVPPDYLPRFYTVASALNTSIASGASAWHPMTLYQNYGNAWGPGSDGLHVKCLVPGWYQVHARHRINCAASRATGYCQLVLDGAYLMDDLGPQGGSMFIDLALTTYPFSFAVGQEMAVRTINQTGGNVTLAAFWMTLVRVAP